MSSVKGKMPPIIHAGLDESGSLTAATPWFVMAAVFSSHPEEIKARWMETMYKEERNSRASALRLLVGEGG